MPAKFVSSREELASKLDYDPATGVLSWKSTGKHAGSKNNGYLRIGKHGVYAHILAVYIITGEWPQEVDHKDHDGFNNRWLNLRPTNRIGNNRNIRVQKNNSTGVLHVHKHMNGYDVRVGKFFRAFTTSFEEACDMAKEARTKYYGEYA